MKKLAAAIILCLTLGFNAKAQSADKVDYFKIDLDEKIPSYAELSKKYAVNNIYDRRYSFYWDIGNKFDKIFQDIIITYGSSDKRLKKEGEDRLLDLIKSSPPEIYPYIGPYLHSVPNMSPKILNLPGIKETKNKFPERIAPQMADIENLEFLSPYLYFLLMPEVWPGNVRSVESAPLPVSYPKVKYDASFYQKIKELVPVEDFYPDVPSSSKLSQSDLRTVNPDQNSPLTSADVQAFMNTLPAIDDFAKQGENLQNIVLSGYLLDAYENEQGRGLSVNALKDMVNPCQRLIQKLKIMGKESDFANIVGGEGFRPNEWAYTCDKTIKAYRVSRVNSATVASILNYQQGVYAQDLTSFPDNIRQTQVSTMQAIIAMYQAPTKDVLEVRKNRRNLEKALKGYNYMLAGEPIAVSL